MGFFKDLFKGATKLAGLATGSPWLTAASTGLDWFASSREAEKNRAFQAGMSNTSYQRAVLDMKAAGLNPALAYSQGGASVPSGAMADLPDIAGAPLKAQQSAATAAQVSNTIQNTALQNAQAAQARASTAKTAMETNLLAKGVPVADFQADITRGLTTSARDAGRRIEGNAQKAADKLVNRYYQNKDSLISAPSRIRSKLKGKK